MDEWKRSGQIPAFGNWDFANELPITQYFETARQAGLIRYSSSSGESDPYLRGDHDLYAVEYKKPVRKGTRNRERRYQNDVMMNEKETTMNMNMRKQGKVYDVTTEHHYHPQRKTMNKKVHVNGPSLPTRLPKPVDEDLYKIPPELLRTTKRKKMLGFISKCLVPAACVS
ncbi:hypothetical protein L195_g035072 [Trifolium pratense]|uniref:RPM1-interacting protein 4-like n=2 Tax=Trifolium pratense TaxID=57577 RepID=A0A2K3LKR6_TRIPR|nr:uncharacterized protein LOC123889614 isoform X2 [Trifolium pratense]PNX79089.1 hypothetical protein L195_g035072 [Trifolium pratense]CAJ2631382.1 unnamed protein product [Trifolium pratense]